jgi:hypothetical protein
MSFKRAAVLTGSLLLTIGLATTAQAATKVYTLGGGSAAQLQIGNGLPLPIQQANAGAVGKVFPNLLIPRATGGVNVTVTTAAPAAGTQRSLKVPAGALQKLPAQLTVGVNGQNGALYAVATNLGFTWPIANATFNTTKRTGPKSFAVSTVGGVTGNNISYSNVKAKKFGGPAKFSIVAGAAAGLLPGPVTVFAAGAPPPCAGCGGILIPAYPAATAAIGASGPTLAGIPQGFNVATPGGPAASLAVTGTFGPNGTPIAITNTGPGFGLTNAANSFGFPWTTGRITVQALLAGGGGANAESFVISGNDGRNASGRGAVQMVAGATSQRGFSGPNANRGWVRIEVGNLSNTPALSPIGQLATGGLIALAAFYIVRRKLVSTGTAAA